jgi:hypothetical protein
MIPAIVKVVGGVVSMPTVRHVEVATITPEVAAAILAQRNTRNRNINDRRLRQYQEEIANGKFVDNGQGITFGSDGSLLDGQHRLKAAVKVNRPITLTINYGVNPDHFATIDTMRPRTAADTLGIAGYSYRFHLAGAARILLAWRQNNGVLNCEHLPAYPHATLKEVVDLTPGLAVSVPKVVALTHPTIAGWWHYVASTMNAEMADQIMHDIRTGDGLAADDPCKIFFNRVYNVGRRKAFSSRTEYAALLVKIWNARYSGRGQKRLAWMGNEEFPMFLGLNGQTV